MSVAAQTRPECTVAWPPRYCIFGVPISVMTYAQGVEAVMAAARRRQGGLVSAYAVHALMTFAGSAENRQVSADFDMITPDGQPVRWALNLLHGVGLKERVYGPTFTLDVCEAAAAAGISVYLYGGSPKVVAKLAEVLQERFPGLQIAGYESPPFRALTDEENAAVVERINGSGAGILLIGLGCPKQDFFAHGNRHAILPVQLCVGAAFDFHAGSKPQAPAWMQRRGLEWLYRLRQEPKRLWKRYLHTNSLYLWRLCGALCARPFDSSAGKPFVRSTPTESEVRS